MDGPPVERAERDRLFSCPDHELHSEAELTKLLTACFTVDESEPTPAADPLLHQFDGRKIPKIALSEYISRLTFYLGNIAQTEKKGLRDPDAHSDLAIRYLIATIIYMDRLRSKGLVVTPLNIHRLLITGVLLASKTLDDLQPGLTYFADLGGLSAAELGSLEVTMLDLLDWKTTIEPKVFRNRYASLLGARDVFSNDFSLDYHRV